MKSTRMIPLGFLGMILIGTILLMLPCSTAAGEKTGWLTAVFTSTTSVCVTGLVVVDTYVHWSLFGKWVILILIQAGGLGFIAVYSLILLMLNKKMDMKSRVLIHDAFNLDTLRGMIIFLKRVLKGTLLVEGVGALFYMIRFIPQYGVTTGIWYSVFHAVSAFCNAGIDILGANSLISYQHDLLINVVTMSLIIMGGLGYVVWFDLYVKGKLAIERKWSFRAWIRSLGEHTKLVLAISLVLIFVGAICIFIFECANPKTMGDLPLGEKILASLFQSVTFRTAGFATIPQEGLTDSTALFGLLLMFIGGSPVGTAGGVKTVTIFLILLNMLSFVKERDEAVVFSRSLSERDMNKAAAIVFVSFSMTLILLLLLMQTNPVNLVDAAYEVFSATGTVGLSRALTSGLNRSGRLILIAAMYLGRIGPISMALFFNSKSSGKNKIHFVRGHYYIG